MRVSGYASMQSASQSARTHMHAAHVYPNMPTIAKTALFKCLAVSGMSFVVFSRFECIFRRNVLQHLQYKRLDATPTARASYVIFGACNAAQPYALVLIVWERCLVPTARCLSVWRVLPTSRSYMRIFWGKKADRRMPSISYFGITFFSHRHILCLQLYNAYGIAFLCE